jgi:hypothetical protein
MVSFTPRKRTLVPVEYAAVWSPEPVSALWGIEQSFTDGNRTPTVLPLEQYEYKESSPRLTRVHTVGTQTGLSQVYFCKGRDELWSGVLQFGPPLWSSGQSSWLQTQRSRVRFPVLPDFLSSSGSGTGSTQPL